MKYLLEHEYGFDPERIGFPSISGCHAILYLTVNGLFGFHNAGGSAKDQWATRAEGFANFVKNHFLGNTKGLHLYGCSFVGDNRRGYAVGKARKEWKEEPKTFVSALDYKGHISGYDLHAAGIPDPGSAYVEYRAAGGTCLILVKRWTDVGVTRGPNPSKMHHKKRTGIGPDTVITSVDTTNMIMVTPEKLH